MVKYCVKFYPSNLIPKRVSALELKNFLNHDEVLYKILPKNFDRFLNTSSDFPTLRLVLETGNRI